MATILKEKNGKNYILKCGKCGSVSKYNEYAHDSFGHKELAHYEDMDDIMQVAFTCPVCGASNSILEKNLEIFEEQSIKKVNKVTNINSNRWISFLKKTFLTLLVSSVMFLAIYGLLCLISNIYG